MEIRVLGPLEVERDGDKLSLGGKKQRSVLAVLVMRAREVIGPERLADAVWDGAPPPSADTTLRGYVSNLRKALEPDRKADEAPTMLRTTATGYVLDVEDESIDARYFERLATLGRSRRDAGDLRGAIEAWTDALALWRGDPFQDFAYSDFVRAEASRLTDMRVACREDLFDVHLQLGNHEAVVGELEAFSSSHPDRERAIGLWMLALYRCERQAEALRVYEEGRRHLASELGVDPSPELRSLHEQILRQDESLAAPANVGVPTGRQTLTFLLGDVESSTEKLRALGDDYGSVLDDHRRTLRDAFGPHGGRAIRTWGDGVFAAFDCATDAMSAAIDAQRVLTGETDESRRLAVRMGLHSGEATFSAGEFVGLAVHLAARIMDAAHGDQILVSQATKELYEAEGGSDAELVDSGMHRLKDIPEPVKLFQAVHPELRRDFPLLRTSVVQLGNLPQRPTSFVGRDQDIEEIGAALAEAGMVTLTGVGGVGKTRLALETGSRLADRYPDGVWFCELAPIFDADSFVRTVAAVLRVETPGATDIRQALLSALGQRKSLVILDNCEHLLEPVAQLVEDIVHETKATHVLATSREQLGVDGERARPVRSLRFADDSNAPVDAVRLFEDRARAVRPDFAVGEDNASHVAEICERLDGIPLAIELAAARVTSMSPAQIADRLGEGFHFLQSGRRAAVDRHRTLQGAIDWSYELLSQTERTLFDRLSVFAGGFSLEAAEQVCGRDLDMDVADGLASLVTKSMVQANVQGREARYSLLETMRQYALDRLAGRSDADAIVAGHARYYVRFFETAPVRFAGLDSLELFPLVRREFGNFHAASKWGLTNGDADVVLRLINGIRGVAWVETDTFLTFTLGEEALAIPGIKEHPLYPVALAQAAFASFARGDRDGAVALATQAIEMIDDANDHRRLLPTYANAYVRFFDGDRETATYWHRETQRVASLCGEEESFFVITGDIGVAMVEAYAGNHNHAREIAADLLPRAQRHSTAMYGWASYVMGEVLAEAGADPGEALEHLDRAVSLLRANGMQWQEGVALLTASSQHARRRDYDDALSGVREAIDRFRFIGVWNFLWTALRNVVEVFCSIGRDEAAAALLAASETSKTALPSYGAQAERLEAVRRLINERMGDDAFARATGLGRSMPDEEAVAYAMSEIDQALELSRSAKTI